MKIRKTAILLVSVPLIVSCAENAASLEQEKYGLVTSVEHFDVHANGFEQDYSVFFNAKGLKDSVVYYGNNTSVLYIERYFHDSMGNVIRCEDVSPDRSVGSSCEYEYDGGFVAHAGMISMGGQEVMTWIHTHDSDHIIHSDYYEEGVHVSSTDYSYDGDRCHEVSVDTVGNVIGTADYVYWKKDKPSSIRFGDIDIRIDYDQANGLPVRSFNVVLSSSGDFIPVPEGYEDRWLAYSYEYDGDGNWTRRAVSAEEGDGGELMVIYREIFR